MSDPLLVNIEPGMMEGAKWASVQRWVKQACINAGIPNNGSSVYLSDIDTGDTDGVKWCKLQQWVKLLANNISGGGGGAPSGPAGGDLTGTYPNPTFDLGNTHAWTALQTFNANVAMASTNSAGTSGVIIQAGTSGPSVPIFHTYQHSPSSGGGAANTPYSLQIFIGPNCGNFTNTADTNIGIGGYDGENETTTTLASLTSGTENIGIGFGALGSLTSGNQNTCVGAANGEALTNGTGNTFFGANCGTAVTTGGSNCAFGESLQNATTGSNNLSIGAQALSVASPGNEDNNTCAGTFSLGGLSAGSNNTALGYFSGYGTSSPSISGGVFIGSYAGRYATASNEFFLNNQDRTNYAGDQTKSLLYGTFAATAAAQSLTVNGVLKLAQGVQSSDGSAGITTSWTTASLGSKTVTVKNGLITSVA